MSYHDLLSKTKKRRRSLCMLIVIFFLIITVAAFALDHAARQAGARQRVWPLGYTGDPNMSVAIFDTGINASHQAFSPGFTQNGDWNSKIVFWYAVEESGSTTPVDDTELGAGHGTHAAGIIAGKGHGLVDTYYDSVLGRNVYRLVNTNAYTSSLNLQYSEQTALRVNAKGLIEIKYAFDSDRGNCDAVYLKFGNVEQAYQPVGDTKIMVGDNTVVASLTNPVGTPGLRLGSTTPDEIQWNTITYRIEDESQYGTYHIITQRSGIASGGSIPSPMAFEYTAKYPVDITVSGGIAMDPDDGLPYYLGMAPDVKLFGVQAASATTFIDSVNALWSEFTTYHVGVLSLSAASSSFSSQASMFNSLENLGIVVCSAGGNEGPAASVSYPGQFENVVTVEGVGPAETIPWYPNTGYEIDILAPGGSNLTGGGIVSVHNNQGNFGPTSSAWGNDVITNDGLGMQGSSMATPSAAGVFALVYDALGGWDGCLNNANFTLDGQVLTKQQKARHVKRLVFMTATELNTKREINRTDEDPTGRDPILNRGYDPASDPAAQYYGKDIHEGYGRVNADAAVEAVLYGLSFNSSEYFHLVSSRAVWSSTQFNSYHIYNGTYDLEKARERKAFARYIEVTQADTNSGKYAGADSVLTLDVPAGADFDLFVYKPSWGPVGEPLLLARGINTQMGADESIAFHPTTPGRYYVVAKAVDGEGDASLTFGTGGGGGSVTASFTYTCQGLAVTFQDTSQTQGSTIVSRQWNFGDGQTSTQQNPVHTYATGNLYAVTLTVTDNYNNTSQKTNNVDLRYDLSPVSAGLTYSGVSVLVNNSGTVGANATVNISIYKETAGGGTTTLLDTQLENENPFTFSTDALWEWGVVSGGPGSAHSGTKAVATNVDGKYGYNANSYAQLTVNLSGSGTKTMEFYHYYDFNGGYSSDTGEDVGFMQISTDGSNWQTLTPNGGYPGTSNNNPVLPNGTPCYTTKLSGWQKVTVDLSSFSTTVYIRFRLISDSSWNYYGWYIDDVKITKETPTSWNLLFQDSPAIYVPAGSAASAVVNHTLTDGKHKVEALVQSSGDSNPANDSLVQEIILGNVLPVANFTFQTNGLTATFTDTSTDSDGTIVSRSWDFGDNQTSTQQNPSHQYQAGGTYTVTLTVTDNQGGISTTSKSVQVTEDTGLLQNNVPVTGLNGASGASLNYRINVPAGGFNLKITTTGSNGDAEIYVKFGSAPTTSVYDFRSIASGSNETITIASPSTGTYHILVYAHSAFTNVTLLAKYDGPFSGPVYTNDTDYTIPDNNTTGVQSPVTVTRTGDSVKVKVTVDIIHTYSGDLTLTLIAPNNTEWVLRARQGGSVDNIKESYAVDTPGIESSGVWKLKVQDLAAISTGYINSWSLQFIN